MSTTTTATDPHSAAAGATSTKVTAQAGGGNVHAPDETSGGHSRVHAVPKRVLLGVFAALMVLTGITVGVTRFDFGNLNIWVALIVAVIKAGLVAMYFMHLRWDSPFNGIVLVMSLLFVAIFIGITVMDTHNYHPNLEPPLTHATP